MAEGIGPTVAAWALRHDRRRLGERALRGAGVGAVGAAALVALAWAGGDPRPGFGLAAFWLAGVALVVLARHLARRTPARAFAGEVDAAFGTGDLVATALAVEAGAPADPELAALVRRRARAAAGELPVSTLAPFRAPRRPLVAGLGAWALLGVAAVVARTDLVEVPAIEIPKQGPERVEVALSEESLHALARDREMLEELASSPGLSREARAAAQDASRRLGDALSERDGKDALGALSQAERSLADLARRAEQGALRDPKELRSVPNERMAEELARSLSRGDGERARAAAEELDRRASSAPAREVRDLGEALDRLAKDNPSGAGSKELRAAADRMRAGDRAGAREALQKAADAGGQSGDARREEALTKALSDVREAKGEQLASMRGEKGGGQGEGAGEGEGTSAMAESGEEGASSGMPGPGKKGGGEGQAQPGSQGEPGGKGGPPAQSAGAPGGQSFFGDARAQQAGKADGGAGGTSPGGGSGTAAPPKPVDGVVPPAEWIEARWDGSPEGITRVIQGSARGDKANPEWREVHQNYAEIAESAAKRETVPLTRRTYVQRYFEAIRPE